MSFNELKSLMTDDNRHEAFAVQCVVFDRCSDDMKEQRRSWGLIQIFLSSTCLMRVHMGGLLISANAAH